MTTPPYPESPFYGRYPVNDRIDFDLDLFDGHFYDPVIFFVVNCQRSGDLEDQSKSPWSGILCLSEL